MPIGSVVRSLPVSLNQGAHDGLCGDCGGALQALPAVAGGGSFCPVCVQRQTEEQDRQEQERLELARRERVKAEQVAAYLADSQLGKRFVGLGFADYRPVCADAARALEVCRGFAQEFSGLDGRSLVFVGSPGTGKNMLSAIIGQEVIRRGFSFLHTSATKVVRRFKDSWKRKEVTEEEVLRYFVGPDLLVIDEIGVQFGSATEQMYLTEVINDRYEARKSTILLSNLTLNEVEAVLGLRAMERFCEDGSRVLVFAWPSWRRQQGKPMR